MNKDFVLQQTTLPEKKYNSGVLIGIFYIKLSFIFIR